MKRRFVKDTGIERLIYPSGAVCVICGCLSAGQILCPVCREELGALKLPETVCPRCGAPEVPGQACGCDLPEGLAVRSVWHYAGVGASLVQTLKFSQVREAHLPLAAGMAETAAKLALPPDTIVTWVTMPSSRWRERAFDHAQLLAEQMGRLMDLPVRPLLRRWEEGRELRHQVGLGAEERLMNLAGTFFCEEALSGTVILVDDVYTTGSTAKAASACLIEQGAAQVYVLTAMRAGRK